MLCRRIHISISLLYLDISTRRVSVPRKLSFHLLKKGKLAQIQKNYSGTKGFDTINQDMHMLSKKVPLKSFTIIWITDIREQESTKFSIPEVKSFSEYHSSLTLIWVGFLGVYFEVGGRGVGKITPSPLSKTR